MRKLQMILGICLFTLVLLFTGCEGAEETIPEPLPVESEELLPESQVEEPESESETQVVTRTFLEKEKETEDEDESEEEKKSSEDSAIWGFGQDGVDSGEDEAFANYLK